MKNQYFGDINDYRKYGILRILARETRLRLRVCWMLTPDDGRSDGRFITYLHQPERWRSYDPPLFDALRESVLLRGERHVARAAMPGIIPAASFVEELLTDEPVRRTGYFKKLERTTTSGGLLFFDQDNGMEVRSVPKGRRGSQKYLYWDEAVHFYQRGSTLLIYQHYPRVERRSYHRRMVNTIRRAIGPVKGSILATAWAAFFLIPQSNHSTVCNKAVRCIAGQWKDQIDVLDFSTR